MTVGALHECGGDAEEGYYSILAILLSGENYDENTNG